MSAQPQSHSESALPVAGERIAKIMHAPDTGERLAVLAAGPVTSSPEEFSTYVKQEIAKWAKVVGRESSIRGGAA